MVSNETLIQTEDNYNSIPRIKVEGSLIKEIEIHKRLIASGFQTHDQKPIYAVRIIIIDDIGGRHEVTSIEGLCRDWLDVKIQ